MRTTALKDILFSRTIVLKPFLDLNYEMNDKELVLKILVFTLNLTICYLVTLFTIESHLLIKWHLVHQNINGNK
jgi:hypothetical protein